MWLCGRYYVFAVGFELPSEQLYEWYESIVNVHLVLCQHQLVRQNLQYCRRAGVCTLLRNNAVIYCDKGSKNALTQYILYILWNCSIPVVETLLCTQFDSEVFRFLEAHHFMAVKHSNDGKQEKCCCVLKRGNNCMTDVCFLKFFPVIFPPIQWYYNNNGIDHLYRYIAYQHFLIANPPGHDDVTLLLFLIITLNTVSPRNRILLMNAVPSYTRCPTRAELQSQSHCLSSLMHKKSCCLLVPLKTR